MTGLSPIEDLSSLEQLSPEGPDMGWGKWMISADIESHPGASHIEESSDQQYLY